MKRVIVIGLGIFGFNIAKVLYENGLEVITIDKNKEMIQKIRDYCTKAILADGTDKQVMEMIGIQEDDVVIVSFGEDLAASSLITLHLRSRYHIEVIAIREVLPGRLTMVPRADFVIKDSDILVIIGRQKDIQKIN